MKKIFNFLLLMISGIVWGQISLFNNLCLNNTNLTFTNDYITKSFKTASETTCFKDDSDIYKSINYYKVTSGGSFEFSYNSTSVSPVNFHVWILSETEIENFFLSNVSRYNSVRSSYSSVLNNEKGLFDIATDECEYYDNIRGNDADGKLKPINVSAGQYIVIGFVTRDANAKINYVRPRGTAVVCEPEPNGGNVELSGKCYDDVYSISEVKNNLQAKVLTDYGDIIDVRNIKIFNSRTSAIEITTDINSTSGLTQNYVAKVYNGSRVEYIYNVVVVFKPELVYDIRIPNTEQYCATSITFSKEDLIYKVSPTINSSKYADYEVYVDGIIINGNISLNNSNQYEIQLKYTGSEFCATNLFSAIVILKLENSNPRLDIGKYAEVCKDEILTEADILLALGVDATIYRLVNIPATPYNFIENEAKFNVQIEDRTNSSCKSNIVEFKVIRKPNVLLNTLPDFETCRSEFTFSEFQTKINEIKASDNSISLIINYNGIDYTETQLRNLYDLILRANTQTEYNLSIKGNKTGLCESFATFKIILNSSNVPTTTFDVLFNITCLEPTENYTFTVTEIENHIKAKLGNNIQITDLAENPLTPIDLNPNSTQTINFKVRELRETCWSEMMTLTLQTINKPNVTDAVFSTKFCEGETLTINDDLLKSSFRANVFDYKIFINGIEYIQGNSIEEVLNFSGNTFLNISIEFKNTLSETCSTIVNLTINKKQDLMVDIAALETYTKDTPIIYCEGDDANAKGQIQAILNYINGQKPGLVAQSSIDEIFDQFNSDKGNVEIVFEDPNYCGVVSIKFFYQRNDLPIFDIPASGEICSDTKYTLDFEQLAKEKGIDVNDYTFAITGSEVDQVSAFVYELGVGNYTITIRDKKSGCPKIFSLQLISSAVPTIDKITINEKSIVVSVKGNGKLEYALFNSVGRIIVDWQTKNELIIPDNIPDNNFTVKVRLNNCGVSERKDVIYLFLPNVVTPNQDGKNDVWQPMTKNGKVNDTSNSYKLIIFDRSGKQILNKEGIDIIKWDGTLNGNPVADGTYWYMLEFSKQSDDLKVLYSGSILVKRKIK
ncbi:gliding motility-associated C-terminal domain-containing protein [Empedobacter brevis]|uniref:T9SS type B sorting domain-containing protein n=1 Tax=Empedobacter brevis TaxID=247 RepID=UPI00123D9A18|nr:T9SS type B sorting domain-containing protein [Empedobacter brevis]QES94208.1 gliding motility-associated C-terminal domain-containing protein [Empedobacter brevis]